MTEYDVKIILLIVAFLLVIVYVSFDSKKKHEKKVNQKLKKGWGKPPKRKISADAYDNIKHYYEDSCKEKTVIDDITWNDLNMDGLFQLINNTNSSVGQEYLYRMLRVPEMNLSQLKEIDRLCKYFTGHEKERHQIQKEYVRLGFTRYISLSDYIGLVVDLKAGSNMIHYLSLVLLVASFAFCLLINPAIGIGLIVLAVAFSIITYYRFKAKVEQYFICITQIVKLLNAAKRISAMNLPDLDAYNKEFEQLYHEFDNMTKRSYLLQSGNVNGSLAEVVLDYIRMLTHVDLIKFNHMVKLLNNKEKQIYRLIDQLGFIESTIAIASFRKMLPYWSVPDLRADRKASIEIREVYHPMIEHPVANTITAGKHVLLTGSNASGKSTFLKTIAINAILSQTIYTSISKEYRAPFFRVYSSMSLRDDLGSSNSYYIVEIKALKRILDAVNLPGGPVLCFVDEVLRGTNTVERIAASSEILKRLKDKNVLCFAATHDIELTAILEKYYDNYHFQEEVTDNDVKFNFRLFKGPATTRNAIKLLNIIGYDQRIIKAAEAQAGYFIDNGIWKM